MNYVEFVETIKSILRYEGNNINPYVDEKWKKIINEKGNIGVKNGFKVGQINFLKFQKGILQEYLDFIDSIIEKSYKLPGGVYGQKLDNSCKEGWYISNHPSFEKVPAIYYYNPKDKGDWGEKSIYIFNPYRLQRTIWINRYSLNEENGYSDDTNYVNYYVGLDILDNINTIKFINWPTRHPIK